MSKRKSKKKPKKDELLLIKKQLWEVSHGVEIPYVELPDHLKNLMVEKVWAPNETL